MTTTMSEPLDTALQPTGPTRRDHALQSLYAGSFSSFLGLAVADVVFPLLVLGFTGKPLLAGLFGTIQFVAMLCASVPAGNFVDRHDRRRILITSELVRATAATVLAVTLASGHVWLAEVYAIAAVLGVCQPFSSIRTLALRLVAPASELTKVLSIQQVVGNAAQLLGPAVGALLYSYDRSLAFAVIAAGMAASALCAYAVRFESQPEPAAASQDTVNEGHDASGASEPEAGGNDGFFAGVSIIWRHPVMRATLLFVMLLNLVAMPLDLVLILQARHEGVPTHYIGLILACFAAGGILGAPFIPKLHRLMNPGRLLGLLGGVLALACAMTAIPFGGGLSPMLWMAGWMAAVGFVIPSAVVLVDVLILQQVPNHQRGRVLSAATTFMALGMPLGSAFGGSMLQLFSPATLLLGTAAAIAAVTLFAQAQRPLRTAAWPAK